MHHWLDYRGVLQMVDFNWEDPDSGRPKRPVSRCLARSLRMCYSHEHNLNLVLTRNIVYCHLERRCVVNNSSARQGFSPVRLVCSSAMWALAGGMV